MLIEKKVYISEAKPSVAYDAFIALSDNNVFFDVCCSQFRTTKYSTLSGRF